MATQNRIQRRGVTLIEALMVITILAASAAAGVYRVSNRHGAARENLMASQLITQLLHQARVTAIAKQADVTVRRRFISDQKLGSQIIPAHWTIDIVQSPSPIPTLEGTTGVARATPMSTSVPISAEVRITGSPSVLQFNSSGSSNRAAQWRVMSRLPEKRGADDIEIRLDPVTGLATHSGTR